jgi:myo-inositol-hexaphosphate 3-phosphohydrolase
VLSNLAAATTKLNVANYERCFARENYIFYPDPGVAQNNVGLFSNWTLQPNELDVLRNFDRAKDGTSLNRLAFANARTNNINADSVEYTADYSLTMQHKDTTFPFYVFTGNLIFSMKRGQDNEYRITRWRDTKTTATPCWTELKQHFATR